MPRVDFTVGADTVNAIAGFSNLRNSARGSLGAVEDAFRNVNRAAIIGTATLSAPIAAAGVAAIKTAQQYELLQVSFETLTRSAQRGQALFREIIEFSARTPFLVPDLAGATQRLLAFGVAQEEVVTQLRRLGDLSLGNVERLNRLTRALGRVRARGRGTLEEINIFLEAGVPLVEELANQFGVAQSEILRLISNGKVGFAEVNAAIISLTSGTGLFAGGLERASVTLAGRLSTMRDNIQLAGVELVGVLIPALNEASLRVTEAARAFSQLPREAQNFVLASAAIVAGIPPLVLAFTQIRRAVIATRVALVALGGPVTIIVAGIAALSAALITNAIRSRRARTEFAAFREEFETGAFETRGEAGWSGW